MQMAIQRLMLAAHNGHHETMLSLLSRSAKINLVNHAHRTALSCAAEKGHDKAVEILLAVWRGSRLAGSYRPNPAFLGHTK
jgi:ankyrin repeat protein